MLSNAHADNVPIGVHVTAAFPIPRKTVSGTSAWRGITATVHVFRFYRRRIDPEPFSLSLLVVFKCAGSPTLLASNFNHFETVGRMKNWWDVLKFFGQ